jgi:hypothetical protein
LKPLRSSIAKYSSVVSSRLKISGYDASNGYAAIPSDDNEGSEDGDIPQSRNSIADSIPADTSQGNHFSIEEEENDVAEVFAVNNPLPSEAFPPPKMESDYLKSKLWCACSLRLSRSLDDHLCPGGLALHL